MAGVPELRWKNVVEECKKEKKSYSKMIALIKSFIFSINFL